jgi:adenine-specific DNA glycosylase
VLDWRDLDLRKHGQGEVRLVQRPNQVSLMPGMWELPQISESGRRKLWRTFRHSITTTDYTVHVVHNRLVRERGAAQPKAASASRAKKATAGSWIPVDRVPQLALTGLSRKILKAGGII